MNDGGGWGYVGSSLWIVQKSGCAGGDFRLYPVGDFLANEGNPPVAQIYGFWKATLLPIPIKHSSAHGR
jgi:hypothetical protein